MDIYHKWNVFDGHLDAITSLKFSHDEKLLASGSADKIIKIWNFQESHFEYNLIQHEESVSGIAWSTNSESLCSCSDDKTVRFWDVATATCVRAFEGHIDKVYCCTFNPQCNLIASGSVDETIRLWDLRLKSCIRVIPAHSECVTSVDFNSDSSLLVSSSFDGFCRIWDVASCQCFKTLIGNNTTQSLNSNHSSHEIGSKNVPVGSAKFSPNSKYIIQTLLNNSINLWDYIRGKVVKTYSSHKNEQLSLSCGFVGSQKVFCSSEDGRVFIWSLTLPEIHQIINISEDPIVACDSAKSGSIIAAGEITKNYSINLWKLGATPC